ncbi:MAG TPA: right-handed parallel beta-helix repeat-containing protein [Terriglobales bacterium]|nr:right-handed parallel beta-helix repeat-containing protein [Terriglobales bacterium]
MHPARFRSCLVVCCAVLFAAFSQIAAANTLCVTPGGSKLCYAKIQLAVNAASNNDLINVAPGTYKEDVVIGKPLSLIGAGADLSVIDATSLANGILLDGYNNPGLHTVTVAGFTVKNALYEGVLVVNTSGATILNNRIMNNDKEGPVFGSGPACKGQPAYETDESGDCGGAIHLLGAVNAMVAGNFIAGNADGILISDDTAESRGNVIVNNIVTNNPLECGIVLASHPPAGSTPPHYAPHYGVNHNTVAGNISSKNGVTVGGAGAGLFSDGEGPGRVSGNLITRNRLTGNGLPGVALHTHVGPAFGAPADNMDGNAIIGNFIAGNGADTFDTATPGTAGININSGGGGSPVHGTIISQNVIQDEAVDIAVNNPVELDAHFNDLLGGNVGVANVCALDLAACTGSIDATENFWGCTTGPGGSGCTTTSGSNISFTPWLKHRE